MYRDKWHLQNITNVFSYCTAISNSKDLKHYLCMSSDKSSLSEEKSRSAVHKCGYQIEILLHLCTNALVLYTTALTEIFE